MVRVLTSKARRRFRLSARLAGARFHHHSRPHPQRASAGRPAVVPGDGGEAPVRAPSQANGEGVGPADGAGSEQPELAPIRNN